MFALENVISVAIQYAPIAGIGAGVGTMIKYAGWLEAVETITERQTTLEDSLQQKFLTGQSFNFYVGQVDRIEERDNLRYRVAKVVPLLRRLRGKTTVSIHCLTAPTSEYVWEEDDMGEDFSTYLREVASDEYPITDHIQTDRISDKSLPMGWTTVEKIRIHSVDLQEVTRVVEQVPAFYAYYFDNYPGASRFQLPY